MGKRTKEKWPYLKRDRDRHGQPRTYVRRHDRKIRIREPWGSVAFHAAYVVAIARLNPATPAPVTFRSPFPPHTLGWLGVQYFASTEFKALDLASQVTRRGILEGCFQEPVSDEHDKPMGFLPLALLEPAVVKRLRDIKKGLPGAANNRRKYLSAMFAWAIDGAEPALMTTNPARDVKRVRYARKGFHTWTREEVAQFKARHPIGTKPLLALALLMFTGLRRGDMVKLGRQHVKDSLALAPGKTRHLGREATKKPWLPILAEVVAQSPCGALTFLETAYGQPFTANGFGNWFRARCNEAGLPRCSAHGLRKCGATVAAENGATIKQLMAIYDWSTPHQAAVYIEAADKKKLAAQAMPLLELGWCPIEPMTLGNMRENGVKSLAVSCHICHHEAIVSVAPWPDHVPVATFARRMVCTSCGIIGADARPNWREQPKREGLTGAQWRS
jgi:integrase